MKNLSLILNLILLVAVIVLYVLHFQLKKNCLSENNELALQIETPQGHIVPTIYFINTDTLWKNFEYVKREIEQLQKEKAKAEGQIEAKARQLESDIMDFQQKVQSGMISMDDARKKEAELMDRQQKLYELREQLAADLLEKEQAKNETLQKAITDYIKKYNHNKNFSYVLGYSQGGGILFANDSLDITKEILEGLNAEYNQKNIKAK
ncbi:MAG: OmpH family outer membrane protein [Bacteroidia bacterium]